MKRWVMISLLAMTLVVSQCILGTIEDNQKEMVRVYAASRYPEVEEVSIVDSNKEGIRIMKDSLDNIIGVIRYKWFDCTIQGIDSKTLKELGIKEVNTNKTKVSCNTQIKKSNSIRTVTYINQYDTDERNSWAPKCAISCMESILLSDSNESLIQNLHSILERIKDIDSGVSANEIAEIMTKLGYKAYLVKNQDIMNELNKGNCIIGSFENNGLGHASIITRAIMTKDKVYYELMNPMGLYKDECYALVNSDLDFNIDTRYFRDDSVYNLKLGVSIERGE